MSDSIPTPQLSGQPNPPAASKSDGVVIDLAGVAPEDQQCNAAGWVALVVDMLYCQTDWDTEKPSLFYCAYFTGMMIMLGPNFCLVMLRMPIQFCSALSLLVGLVLIFSPYARGSDIATYAAFPLLQVPARLQRVVL